MRKKMLIPILAVIAVTLSGCGDSASKTEHQVLVDEYERITYNYVTVSKGDITPTVSLKLTTNDLERKSYFAVQDEMEVDQVYVASGDIVSAGQVLVSFKSGDISDQIDGYESRAEEIKLLINHYTNLSEIDKSLDYSEDLASLAQELEICNMYIQELTAKLESYSIKAEHNGVVFQVSELLNYGTVNSTDNLVIVLYGSGLYNASTADDYDFKIGETHTATYGVASYEMEIVSVEDDGEDANGNTLRKVTFKFAGEDGTMAETDTLNMVIEKKGLSGVLYVPEEAVFKIPVDKNGSTQPQEYVYVLDELGFRHATEVNVGSTVDGNTVINLGLQDGDKVVVK